MIKHNLYRSQTLRMIFMLAVFMLLSASQGLAQILGERFAGREYRAVWLTTLSGLDWPSRPVSVPSDTLRQQQALRQILDRLQQAGINTVIFQTRIRATVAYPSNIEPWDGAFSGTPGRGPGYDPLAFALRECHKRGMELHAWVVAFPICNATLARRLGAEALPKKHPELCHRCGDAWFMDPGVPATAQYVAGICREIVERYDVDGIHLDYIRYPEESVAWKDQATYRKYGNGKRLGDWRRENVSRVVREVHDAVKSVRPWVKLSCSPVGKRADLPRQSSYGWNAREAVYQDAAQWLQQGLMDVLFPMMYFDGSTFIP
uniref:glycoside hydrolase family 10 protein n=1 Tax=Alloprevotella sp. TaxID=1872471 RepID=UPI004027C62C